MENGECRNGKWRMENEGMKKCKMKEWKMENGETLPLPSSGTSQPHPPWAPSPSGEG